MTIAPHEYSDLPTPSGLMRTHVVRPAGSGCHPGIILYSEIFQVTGPIRRMAVALAGHGYVVAVPEIFHEHEPLGTVLAYDTLGTERGNWCKINKPLQAYDDDTLATVGFLRQHPACTGKVGTIGICIGGHLAYRCAMVPDVLAAVCFYPTDIHKLESHPRGLGTGLSDDSLERVARGELRAEMLMIWGRQDPHIPWEGRRQVHAAMEHARVDYQWLEVNGEHAFLRDEGLRFNPVLARQCIAAGLEVLDRRLK